jgi:hypothetical protein
MRAAIVAVFAVLSLIPTAQDARADLKPSEQVSLKLWLDGHKDYRLATDDDCKCASDLQELRTTSEGVWKAKPDFVPYFVRGDFRNNGHADFAVVVVKDGKTTPTDGLLLIFDGPFGKYGSQPNYVGKVAPLVGAGLNVPPNSSWPVYGRYFSEGCYYKPQQRAYREVCDAAR